MKHRNYSSWLPFIDMLFATLTAYVFMFIVSWLLINPAQSNKIVDAKGEFLIIVTWPDNNKDDVDTWVEDPQHRVVWFREKSIGLMNLDRDDLGMDNDQILDSSGVVQQVATNREVVTIRGFIPGEYIVNLHMFKKNELDPTTVNVEVLKVNPPAVIANSKVTLRMNKEEQTVLRFTVDGNGYVTNKNTLKRNIVKGDAMTMGTTHE